MSRWQDFLEYLSNLRETNDEKISQKHSQKKPGPVLICFVNRYYKPADSIRYRIECEGRILAGVTSEADYTVEVHPTSLQQIKVFAWSRVRKGFKLIDTLTPAYGPRQLVYERMKTYKQDSKTKPHPQPDLAPPVKKPATTPPSPAPKRNDASAAQQQGATPTSAANAKGEPEHQTSRQVTDKILSSQLKLIFPAADEAFLGKVADELNTDLTKYKLDTALRRAHFFAQVRQEAGVKLSPKDENLNYKPSVLVSKFSYYQGRSKEAEEDGRLMKTEEVEKLIRGKKKKVSIEKIVHPANQQVIANKAYGNRNGNGNIASGDGWKFRGRGIFQLTGRDNYSNFNREYPNFWTEKLDFISTPDKVCDFPHFIRSAVWFWVKNKAYLKADGGSTDAAVNAITRIVNGKAMDAAEKRRENFHELAYPAFK